MQQPAKNLLDATRTKKDSLGASATGARTDDNRFDDAIPGESFVHIGSWNKQNPIRPTCRTHLISGNAPTFTHHRFRAQVDVAPGYADFARLFPNG